MSFRLVLSVIFTMVLILDIESVSNGVLNAMRFCADSLIPSLLIFFIMSDLITKSVLSVNNNKISPKWTAFLLGSACGFPIGATICDAFIQNRRIDKKSAEMILPFCNNTSPAFVLGAIGVTILKDIKFGLLLYISEILAAFLLVAPIKCKITSCNSVLKKSDFLKDFQDSIEKAIGTTLKMCVIVCFFSAILSFLEMVIGEKLYAFTALILEIGNGVYACSSIFESNKMLSITLLGFLCGWSGICVHIQIVSAVKSIKVKLFRLISSKCLQGLLTALISSCAYKLFFNT